MNKTLNSLCEKIVEGLLSAQIIEKITEAIKNELNFALVEIERAKINAGDILVLRYKGHLTDLAYERLQETTKRIFPDIKCIILEEDIGISIIENGLEQKQSAKT